MAIEHLSDAQLISIVNHARRREKRYSKMYRELNIASGENARNAADALAEIERRQLAVRDRLGAWAMDDNDAKR